MGIDAVEGSLGLRHDVTAKIKITDRGYARLLHTLESMKAARVTVGVHAAQGNAQHAVASSNSNAAPAAVTLLDVAAWNEFGMGVPERPWLRGWFDQNTTKNQKTIATIAKSILQGRRSIGDGLEAIGARFVGELQQWISDGSHVLPDAASTVRAKGSSVPLIDTGQLRTSITYTVRLTG